MAVETRELDLASLRLSPGEGCRLTLESALEPLSIGSERYLALAPAAGGGAIPLDLSVSRMNGGGYALRLRFSALVAGPCMRCLEPASPRVEVEAREVDVPDGGEELDSPYVHEQTLELARWARDAFALALPTKVLCREECAGLCPICAADLNVAGPEHHHERAPDARWAKLRELKIG